MVLSRRVGYVRSSSRQAQCTSNLGVARIVFSDIASSRVMGDSVLLKNSLGIGVSGVAYFALSFVIVACVSSAIHLLVSVLAAEENSLAELP